MIKLTTCDPKVLDLLLADCQRELGLKVCVADEVVEIEQSLLEQLRLVVETNPDLLHLTPEIQNLIRLQLEQHRLLFALFVQDSREQIFYPSTLAKILGTSAVRMAQVHQGEMPLGEFDGTQWWFVVKD